MLALGRRHQFPAPALQLGIALVHAVEIAGEQGRLVTARAGADLDQGVGAVILVLGQEQQAHLVLELGQALLEGVVFLARHLRHFGVPALHHLGEILELGTCRLELVRLLGDGLQLGVLLGELDDFVRIAGGARRASTCSNRSMTWESRASGACMGG